MKAVWKAHLAVLTANVIYGANYSVAKQVMPAYFAPFGIIVLRVTGAIILFAILFSGKTERIRKEDWMRFVMCGITGVACNQLLFFKGLSLTSPIEAAIILTANPVLVLIASAILARERVTPMKALGILIGLCGALLLILQRPTDVENTGSVLGNLMILLNAAFYAVYLVIVRPLMQRYRASTVMLFVFLCGLLPVLPVGMNEVLAVDWMNVPAWAYWSLGFIVVGATFLAYILNAYALATVSSSVVSIYIYTQPFLAALIAIAWGKDELDVSKIISAALVFAGVWLTSRPVLQKQKTT
jgi:drug/metabolite transporter (DMT)-like permease